MCHAPNCRTRLVTFDGMSVTAELLAGARELSLADRRHFELNLSDLLDKSAQCKRNWLLNVIAARQRFERQQADFEGIQTLSIANSKLIKWMTAGRASWWSPLTLSFPMPHPLGTTQSPVYRDQRCTVSSAEDAICDHPERPNSSLAFPTATMCAGPCISCTNLQQDCRNCSDKTDQPQRNAARWSPHDVDCSLVAPAAFCSALILILSQLEHPFQACTALKAASLLSCLQMKIVSFRMKPK